MRRDRKAIPIGLLSKLPADSYGICLPWIDSTFNNLLQLEARVFKAWQIYPNEVRYCHLFTIFSAGEAEAGSGGDRPAKE
jgi:hypothetical protein